MRILRSVAKQILERFADSATFFFLEDNLREQIANYGWNIGKYSYGNPKVFSGGRAKFEVGKYCSFAEDVVVILSNHNSRHTSTYPFSNITDSGPEMREVLEDLHASATRDIVVGNDVWIGKSVTLLPGAVIGDGAIIGACSVVRSEIPPYAIAIGNPCQILKYRFDDRTIEKLLQLAWWSWPHEKVLSICELLRAEPEHLLQKFGDQP